MEYLFFVFLLGVLLLCSSTQVTAEPEGTRKIIQEKTEYTYSDGFITATYTEIRSAKDHEEKD